MSNAPTRQRPNAPTLLTMVGLLGLLAVGGWFRWRYAETISLYVDEFTTMWAAQRILAQGVPLMPSGVLYTRGLLASYVEAAFLGTLGFSYTVARLPNVLFGLATIVLIFAVGRRLWDARVGWLAAVGLTLLPEAIVWSGRARFYAQLQFFVLLAAWAAFRSLRDGSWRVQGHFALLFALALFTQEETLLLYPAWALAVLLWRGPRWARRPPVLAAHALCWAAMGLRYLVEILGQPGYFETIQAERPYVGLIFDPRGAWATYAPLFTAPERLPWTLLALVALVAALAALRPTRLPLFQDGPAEGTELIPPHATLFFALSFVTVLGVVLLFVGPTWRDPRYLFIVQPFWLLLGAAGAVSLIDRFIYPAIPTSPFPLHHSHFTILLGLLAFLAFLPSARATLTKQEEGYDLALTFLARERQPGDVVMTPQPPACALLLGPCDFFAIQRGYEEYVIGRDGVLVDRWSGAPLLNETSELEQVIRRAPRTWFVVDSFRLATRYEAPFLETVIEQFDVAFDERGILVLRAEGWRDPPPVAAGAALEPPARFGPLALVAWERGPAMRGEPLPVTLVWQGEPPIGTQINTFVHLVAPDGARVAQDDGPPARGLVPTVLFDAKPLPDPKMLPLPSDLAPGRYRLDAGAYRLDTLAPLGEPRPLDWLWLGPPPEPPAQPVGARWQDGLRLVGHDGLPATLRPGDGLDLRLVWAADAPPSADYTVFVHLVPTGETQPAAQADRAPEGGFFPTSAWAAGDTVADTYRLDLPTDAPPGPYRLLVGLYQPAIAARLPLADGRDALELGVVEVGE